jgi:hypothetical protein
LMLAEIEPGYSKEEYRVIVRMIAIRALGVGHIGGR